MWDFIWLNHKNSCWIISYGHREDAVKYPRIQKVQARVQFFQAVSSVSAIHLLVIVGDYLVHSPLLWRVGSTVASPSESSHPTLRMSKNRRKLRFLCSSPFSKHHHITAKPHAKTKQEMSKGDMVCSLAASPCVGALYSAVENHFWSYVTTVQLLIKKKKKNPSPSFQPGGRFHTKKTTQQTFLAVRLYPRSYSKISNKLFNFSEQNARWNPSTSDNLKKPSVSHMGNFTFTESFSWHFSFWKEQICLTGNLFFFFILGF